MEQHGTEIRNHFCLIWDKRVKLNVQPRGFFCMRKLYIFLTIFIITLSVLLTLALVGWYLAATAPSYYGSSWMSQMWGSHLGSNGNYGGMGEMMGSSNGTTTSYLWLVPVALIAVVAVSVIGVAFYVAFPQLRYVKRTCE